jgi:hypothetical protein
MRTALALALLSLCACAGGSVEFRPKEPKKIYKPLVQTASRIHTLKSINECGADEIGLIHTTGEPDEVVAAMAEEVADNGGTHYIVRGDDTTIEDRFVTSNGSTTVIRDRNRHAWALVYRLEKSGWDCAGFHPHER